MMKEHHPDNETFTLKHLKSRLLDHFGEDIIITNMPRLKNVVTFRPKVSKILYDFHKLPKCDDPEEEKMNIIRTASQLIKSDIKEMPANKDTYPVPADIESQESCTEFVPKSLKLLLSVMFPGSISARKIASIGQAIVQAVRPTQLIAPLQIGLGVQMHHHFTSKYLVDILSNLGFASSYKEVENMNAVQQWPIPQKYLTIMASLFNMLLITLTIMCARWMAGVLFMEWVLLLLLPLL